MEYIGYFLALLVGLVLGTLGGGGSILAVPILVVFFAVEPKIATVYSLFIVGTTSAIGVISHFKRKMIQAKTALLFGLPAVISIACTRLFIMPAIPEIIWLGDYVVFEKNTFIMLLFGILMILASLPLIRGQKDNTQMLAKNRPGILMLFGILVGFISGLVGAGGGFLIIPSLSIFMKVPIKNAIATSIFIIAINSLSGFTAELIHPNIIIQWKLLLSFTAVAIAGLIIGLLLNNRVNAVKLKMSFGIFVLLIGLGVVCYEAYEAWLYY